jgi:CMP-N-acetylneuraminic acid synthetase
VDAVASGRHESAFAALEMRKFAWFEGKPLNYSLDRPVPRTQDLTPVYVEQSGLYVFSTRFFAERRCRISPDAYMKIVDPLEGHDIDTNEDFELAEMMLPYIKGHR